MEQGKRRILLNKRLLFSFAFCRNGRCGGFLKKNFKVKDIALYGMLIALAMVLSFIETMLPIPMGIPGIKLGLANLVVIVCLYLLGERAAFVVSLIRIVLIGFTFASLSTMMYSMAGGAFSLFCMITAKKFSKLSMPAVSILGAISHNIAQLAFAGIVVGTAGVFSLLPYLLTAAVLSGLVIGILAVLVIKRTAKLFNYKLESS